MSDYYSEENVIARVKAVVDAADKKSAEKYKQIEQDCFLSFRRLIGHTITDAKRDKGSNEDTYIIILDDGTEITAVDGEYGDNAFTLYQKGDKR